MPEPDCFLRYRLRCNAEFYYVGKISRIGIGRRPSTRGFKMVLFTASRGNNFVGGTCAPPTALLVLCNKLLLLVSTFALTSWHQH